MSFSDVLQIFHSSYLETRPKDCSQKELSHWRQSYWKTFFEEFADHLEGVCLEWYRPIPAKQLIGQPNRALATRRVGRCTSHEITDGNVIVIYFTEVREYCDWTPCKWYRKLGQVFEFSPALYEPLVDVPKPEARILTGSLLRGVNGLHSFSHDHFILLLNGDDPTGLLNVEMARPPLGSVLAPDGDGGE